MNTENYPKIVLVTSYNFEALGARSLLTCLQEAGYKNSSLVCFRRVPRKVEENKKKDLNLFKELIDNLRPDIIGVSNASSGRFKTDIELIMAAKNKGKAVILFGGIHPTVCPNDCIDYADVVCVGGGCRFILEFALAFRKKSGRYKDIKSLWAKNKNITKANNFYFSRFPNENIPIKFFPENEYYIEKGEIVSGVHYLQKFTDKFIYMCSSGCLFNCSYCNSNTMRKIFGVKQGVDLKNIKEVIDQLKYYKSQGAKYIIFSDRVFPWQDCWIDEFSCRYKSEINLPFSIFVHPSLVKRKNIESLVSAGLDQACMGIQPGSERIRREVYGRKESNEDIIKDSVILSESGVKVLYDLILDNPYEFEKDYCETFKLLMNLRPPFKLKMHSLAFSPIQS